MTDESAQILGIQALGFLASDPERLGRFLALSGIGPEMIREAAQEPGFLAGVLEHVASDESLLLVFAEHARIAPGDVRQGLEALAGKGWERETP